MSPATAPLITPYFIAGGLLRSAVVVKRWQDMLAQYPLTADQRATFDPLLKVELNPSVATFIAHAEAQGSITFE